MFVPGLYHNVADDLSSPMLIVAFNCGIHEYTGTSDDTWSESLPVVLSKRVPIVLTSYTASEAQLDVGLFRQLDPTVDSEIMGNPFCGMSPLRDVDGVGVYHTNEIISIIKFGEGEGGDSSSAELS